MSNVYVPGYLGLGDNIYLRPTIRELKKRFDQVYVRTPWPEVFEDLDIFPVKPVTNLRTQNKNIEKQNIWYDVRPDAIRIDPRYSISTYRDGMNPCQAFERAVPSTEFNFDMPTYLDERARELSQDWGDFAIIRPCTVRKEWAAPARNCDPDYIKTCTLELRGRCITTIEISDVDGVNECYEGVDNPCYETFSKGQLSPMLIASLMKLAVVTVAPVGFVLPMGIAVGAPTFNIFGGYLSPDVMVDDRMDLSNYGFAAPDPFCSCYNRNHKSCHKSISKLAQTFINFLNRVQNRETSQA